MKEIGRREGPGGPVISYVAAPAVAVSTPIRLPVVRAAIWPVTAAVRSAGGAPMTQDLMR